MGSLRLTLRGLGLVLAAVVWISVAPLLWRVAETWGPEEWFLYGPMGVLLAGALWSIGAGLMGYLRWRMEPPPIHELPTGAAVVR